MGGVHGFLWILCFHQIRTNIGCERLIVLYGRYSSRSRLYVGRALFMIRDLLWNACGMSHFLCTSLFFLLTVLNIRNKIRVRER